MNTPITDRLASPAGDFVRNTKVIHVSHAKKLELDRAALMEAVADYCNPMACRQKTHEKLLAALAAARANFPEP